MNPAKEAAERAKQAVLEINKKIVQDKIDVKKDQKWNKILYNNLDAVKDSMQVAYIRKTHNKDLLRSYDLP
jgi:uncharacterized coiled-coil protein SlyX